MIIEVSEITFCKMCGYGVDLNHEQEKYQMGFDNDVGFVHIKYKCKNPTCLHEGEYSLYMSVGHT